MSLGLAPGTTFAGYRVQSIVGRGGMGVVYRATELSLQRPVALKLIAPELAEDEDFRRRFLRESRLAASLEHPNVVPIYEAGEHERQLYLAMRYVEGSDLRTVLKRDGPLAPERTLGLLAQIADALDAAHRRGLVHRDVKPANVLLDDDGHAYLTDFGVTKQLGGDSTESGQLVGTLDYLAPEQIRGDPIDARADIYALACVIYQCLTGAAPFHRATEAETLWAHMQEEPPQLPQHPALTPVLKKGLAKARDDRYGSCAELIEEARAALARGRVRRALLRRRHAILTAGLLALAATTTAAIVAITKDDGPRPPPAGDGIAAISADGAGVGSFTEAGTAPSNIAVGEGAVWVLNADTDTIARIDPETKRVVKVFRAGARLSDLAAGGGALWVGHGSGQLNVTARVSRVDPESGAITRTVRLPVGSGEDRGPPSVGYPRLAVGAGAVWASSRDETMSRIDAATGRVVESIDVDVGQSTIAAGAEGVWFLGEEGSSVMSVDPRTNRVGQEIAIPSASLGAIAVGAGSVWATSPQEGLLWRIEPEADPPIVRSIELAAGAGYLAFGEGAAWVANYGNGTVYRIDPRTNDVAAVADVGASQAIAAGAGAAWASVAAGGKDGTLPASRCSDVASGGQEPDVLIASDLPLQGVGAFVARGVDDTIRFVLKEHGFTAGRYVVGYQSCDDSTAQTGFYEQRRCAANANAYANAHRLVALVGPLNSYCAQAQIATLNQAPGGPLAMVTPSASFPNLTRSRFAPPELGLRGDPDVYYPTGVRNFFRLTARDDQRESATAVLSKRLGLDGVYLLRDRAYPADDTFEDAYRWAASRLGVRIAGAAEFDGSEKRYDALAVRVARSGADGVVIYDEVYNGGDQLLKALRARLGRRIAIIIGEGFLEIPDVIELAGPAARGAYMTALYLPPDAFAPTPALERLTRELGDAAHGEGALQAAEATEVVLRAIERSDGTRASVLRQLQTVRVDDGLFGAYRFDRGGDMTPARVAVLRITGSTPASVRLPSALQGAVIDRVLTLPASLEE